MNVTKIVTTLVLISLASVGCRAKFTSQNGPKPVTGTSATPETISQNPSDPVLQPPQMPEMPPAQQPPVVETPTPAAPMVPQVQVPGQNSPLTHPAVVAPQCPTDGDSSIDPRREVIRKTIVFKTGRQMIWRKNCDGKVISKRYEDLGQATSQNIKIRSGQSGQVATVFNRTTCHSTSSQNLITLEPSKGRDIRLAVSLKPSDRAMLVKVGKNLIDYDINGGKRGTLILTVLLDSTTEDCIVINARNCPKPAGKSFSQEVFGSY